MSWWDKPITRWNLLWLYVGWIIGALIVDGWIS